MTTDQTSYDGYDAIIIGAGISGINAAYRIQTELPEAKYTILEARDALGGTWDFFRYPGIRSDSDLHVFGFEWRPWKGDNFIAEGADIRDYVAESAAVYGIDQKIQFHHKMLRANWSSEQQSWNLLVDANGTKKNLNGRFIFLATGYYDYSQALPAIIPGIEGFGGTVVHPQFWPEELDYTDKKIVIIGSGATAITLVPSLAKTAKHVTMLQRSPSYFLTLASVDPFKRWLSKTFPSWPVTFVHQIVRCWVLLISYLFIKYCKTFPNSARRIMMKGTAEHLPSTIPLDPHFIPAYNPGEQRICVTRDGEFWDALNSGKADIVTGTINSVSKDGIEVTSVTGEKERFIDADIIITATGLKILVGGGATCSVDNEPATLPSKFLYKGFLIQDIPNIAAVIGYADSAWTLGADATALHVCRLLKYMKKKNYTSVVPRVENAEDMKTMKVMDLNSTYFNAGLEKFPRCGDKGPWKARKAYFWDLWEAKFGGFEGLAFE